jgi:hypothetical protein
LGRSCFIEKNSQALHDKCPAETPGQQPGGIGPAGAEGNEEIVTVLSVFDAPYPIFTK